MGGMPLTAEKYGRPLEEWEQLINAAIEILQQTGRDRRNPTIPYSDLNDRLAALTGQPKFDFGNPLDRKAIGALLSDVNDRTMDEIEELMDKKLMLSSLVWLKGEADLGKGFYDYARAHGLLTTPGRAARDEFMVRQLIGLSDYCNRLIRPL
jgi:hypothetical protein